MVTNNASSAETIATTAITDASPVRVSADRWRPERAGLINVWQYTNEVLHFDHGRMVLFGPNGSGKTMALELLLPYLLDARGQPGRLSTSGIDRGGLWSRVTGYDNKEARTGYLWVEFRRPSGQAFTCGVRLRANASDSGEKHWFTTSARFGADLELLDAGGHPLGPERLREVLGDRGKVWGGDTNGYRTAVRQTLFAGRSEDQLESMIRTLLMVRKQNVSDGLSPAVLSQLLSQALPPLDDLELGKVAEGFADLDRRRDHIAGLDADLHVVTNLVKANRLYAAGVTSRVVHGVVAATTEFDRVTRDLRKAESELETLRERAAGVEEEREALEDETRRLAGEKEGLEASEEYKEGRRLAGLKNEVADHADALRRAERGVGRERDALQRQEQVVLDARGRQAEAARRVDRTRRDLEAAVTRLDGPSTASTEPAKINGVLSTWLDARRAAIRTVRSKLAEHSVAVRLRDGASEAKTKAADRLDEAEDRLNTATQRREEAEASWWTREEQWRGNAAELGPYLERHDDPWAASAGVNQAFASARDPIIEARSGLNARRTDLESQLADVEAELTRVRDGAELVPEAPAGRRDREGLEGAPLWRLLDFDDGLSAAAKDGIESALLDARVLDAWVTLDGAVELESGLADIVAVVPADETNKRSGAAPVRFDPSAESERPELVNAILDSIVWVERDAHLAPPQTGLVVGHDGSWRTPHLAGRAPVGPARFIGAASREAARLARIDELEHQRDELVETMAACVEALELVRLRLERCDAERASFPNTAELDDAVQEVRDLEGRVEHLRVALHEANDHLRAADATAKQAQIQLMQAATEHALPTTPDGLDEADAQVTKVDAGLQTLARAVDGLDNAKRAVVSALEHETEARERVERGEETARKTRLKHEEVAAKLRALEDAVGKTFQELTDRLQEIRLRMTGSRDRLQELQHLETSLARQAGGVEKQRDQAATARDTAERYRTEVHQRYVDLVRDGLVRDAALEINPDPNGLETLTAQLESARRVRQEKAIRDVPADTKLTQRLNKVHEWQHKAAEQLAGRITLTFEPDKHDWSLLRARQDGLVKSGPELRERITEDRDRAKDELDQKQQALFEEILTGSLREHLKDRLWSADALVNRINTILGGVRSAAGGVGVTLAWEIDSDIAESASLKRAKELLLHDSPVSDGRTELDTFLRNRIEQLRADDADTGDWKERLERMLDYRDWHRFVVKVHHKRFGEQPRSLASRNVSLSAGEKTIVMVLPLLAAVVAHYEPASDEPPCESPRLLLMDELFPKLDFVNKRQLMGLLPTLHLDGVFTSDKDRCEYDTLDGIAIHLFQKLDDEKTTTTRMVWNGRNLRVTPDAELATVEV